MTSSEFETQVKDKMGRFIILNGDVLSYNSKRKPGILPHTFGVNMKKENMYELYISGTSALITESYSTEDEAYERLYTYYEKGIKNLRDMDESRLYVVEQIKDVIRPFFIQ